MLRSGLRRGILASARLQSGFAKQARDVLEASEPTLSELVNGVRVVTVSNNKPVTTVSLFLAVERFRGL